MSSQHPTEYKDTDIRMGLLFVCLCMLGMSCSCVSGVLLAIILLAEGV